MQDMSVTLANVSNEDPQLTVQNSENPIHVLPKKRNIASTSLQLN